MRGRVKSPPYWLEKKEAKNQPENVEIFSYKNKNH